MIEAVIFDIDGTLADVAHRRHHVVGGRDWGSFFAAMGDDPCIEPVRWLAQRLSLSAAIVLCSGRPERYRGVTEEWLGRHGISYSALYMRPADDMRPDYVVKSQILDGIVSDGYQPLLVVDDRPSVVAMWRERGLICLQCADWDEAPATVAPGMLTLMVGPSGAGKSTWLRGEQATALGIHPSHIISSDQLRADLCGDFRDQSRNDDVFAALHALAKCRLARGLPTAIDATNLRRKDRLACVDLAPPGAPVRYVVINRPMDDKRRDAGWRAEIGIDLIAKHEQTFKSQAAEILRGDDRVNVTVVDIRQ